MQQQHNIVNAQKRAPSNYVLLIGSAKASNLLFRNEKYKLAQQGFMQSASSLTERLRNDIDKTLTQLARII